MNSVMLAGHHADRLKGLSGISGHCATNALIQAESPGVIELRPPPFFTERKHGSGVPWIDGFDRRWLWATPDLRCARKPRTVVLSAEAPGGERGFTIDCAAG